MTGKIFIWGVILTFLSASCLKTHEKYDYSPEKEQELLKEYLDNLVKAGHNLDTTELGVYYITLDQGAGNYPQTGDLLSVQYAGYFVTGEFFDSSIFQEDSTFHFRYKEDRMIKGWEDILGIMNKGARLQFIVPSNLAYGAEGSGISIPPYTTLVFVAKMMNITPKEN